MRSAIATVAPSPNTQLGRAQLQRELASLVHDAPIQQHLADSFALLHERFALRHDIAGAEPMSGLVKRPQASPHRSGAGRAVKAIASIAVLRRATEEKIARLAWLLHDPAARAS